MSSRDDLKPSRDVSVFYMGLTTHSTLGLRTLTVWLFTGRILETTLLGTKEQTQKVESGWVAGCWNQISHKEVYQMRGVRL